MVDHAENADTPTGSEQSPRPHMNSKEKFSGFFRQEYSQIFKEIDCLEEHFLVEGERQKAVDHLLGRITKLSHEVSDANEYNVAYDQRANSQAIKALEDKLRGTQARMAPKAKFRFKTKIKDRSGVATNDSTMGLQTNLQPATGEAKTSSSNESLRGTLVKPESVGNQPLVLKNYNETISRASGGIRRPSFSLANNIDISNHKDLHIILPLSASCRISSGSITHLSGCVVDMSIPSFDKPFNGLALVDIQKSLVIAGQVAGAAHITGVEGSIIVVAARQVRLHNCKNLNIYLHCASRPIIEDCSKIQFSPLPQHFTTTAQEQVRNQWDQVDDFKWLKSVHSPNWSTLPEDKRLDEATWSEVISGHEIRLAEILKDI